MLSSFSLTHYLNYSIHTQPHIMHIYTSTNVDPPVHLLLFSEIWQNAAHEMTYGN